MNKNILISGAGIAGLTLAYWLKKYGFNPTIVELSPKLREGGYAIDFFGSGYDVAEKMGILPILEKADLKIHRLTFVNKDNKETGTLNVFQIRKLMRERMFNLLRSDLARIIYNSIDDNIEFIFGESVFEIEQGDRDIHVTFKSGTIRSFDLLIGADGLHSNVRSLVFGYDPLFERYYGYYTASFTVKNYLQNDNFFVAYNTPGRQASIYSLNENRLTAVFIFASPNRLIYHHHDIDSQKQILCDAFSNEEWECPALLAEMDAADDFYFDSVSQISLNQWSHDRIALVGDACYCPSLLSGQGSMLAMLGAYVLAGEMATANGNYKVAYEQYKSILRPLILQKQKLAQSFAGSLVPKSNFGIWVRNRFTNAMFSSFAARWLVKKYMTDDFELRSYTHAI